MKRNTKVDLISGSFAESENAPYPAIVIDNKYCIAIIGASQFNFKTGIVWDVVEFTYNEILNRWLVCTGQYSNQGKMFVTNKNYVNIQGLTVVPPKTIVESIDPETGDTIESSIPDLTGLFPQFDFFKNSPIGQGITTALLSNLTVRIPDL